MRWTLTFISLLALSTLSWGDAHARSKGHSSKKLIVAEPSVVEAADGPTDFWTQDMEMSEAGQLLAVGVASWYGPGFHGRRTASGERYNMHSLTCASRTLPFGTRLMVKNLENGQEAVVRVNDRGPFHRGRILDLSLGAAKKLGFVGQGSTKVEIRMASLI